MKNVFIVFAPVFIRLERMNAIEGKTFKSKDDIYKALKTKPENVDIMRLSEFKIVCNEEILNLTEGWISYVSIEN